MSRPKRGATACAPVLLLVLSAMLFGPAGAAQVRQLEPFPQVDTGERVITPAAGAHPFYTKLLPSSSKGDEASRNAMLIVGFG